MSDNLSTLNFFFLGTTEQATCVVAGAAFVKKLTEHLDPGDCRLNRRAQAHDFDVLTGL